ncbi:uncharacterized protein LOC122081792 [Macadamia integrifolia]|uniref:uncharacterized protein LOC122081792 n=1 Tax=Macadamia integrifolia TaxID=60698 RepID=UPI001C4EAE83|nr:uncharacterized protein LOC122081792 [Macadamia integrifolia]XP_042505013.1 uncharacterized protein LOC122081792 [Macadamia integrifolia]XP_042505014.1 uncharacterized protein LOC122081792 [Macadamia integrifolia]
MTKKSKRRPPCNGKDQSSCMSGFISLFDFRLGRTTQKLLSDRKCRTRHAVGGGYLKSRRNLPTSMDETCSSSDDGDIKIQKVGMAKTSVKKLIEEEMSNEQHPKLKMGNAALKETQSDSKNKNHLGKNHKQSTKSFSEACDMHVHDSKASASLEYQPPSDPDSEGPSSNKINLASVMEEFCNKFHHTQEAHPHHENGGKFCSVQESTSLEKLNHLDKLIMQLIHSPNISEKLSEATEAFLNQKFIEAEQQSRGHQSQQFMDALEMLNSNKELFLKLLQDPNSLLVKNIQDLRDAQAVAGRTKPLPEEKLSNSRECEKIDKKLQRLNVHTFFRRKMKPQNINQSKGSDTPQALDRIVLLKPGPEGKRNSGTETSPSLRIEEQSVRVNSRFSLTDIRRKLKHVMGERRTEHRWPPMEGSLDRIPCKRAESEGRRGINGEVTERSSPRECNFHIEKISSPMNVKGRGKVSQSKDYELITRHEDAPTSVDSQNINIKNVEDSKQRESNIYIEAIKHLAQMVSTGEDVDLSSGQIPKTLGRILSLPEYSTSPRFHPGRDEEHASLTAQMRVQLQDNVQMISENVSQLEEDKGPGNLTSPWQNIETPLCQNDDKDSNSDISQKLPPDRRMQESTSSANEVLSPDVDVNTIEVTSIKHPEENTLLEMLSKPDCVTAIDTTNLTTDTIGTFEEEETYECLKLDSNQKNQPSSSTSGPSSPSSVLINKIEDQKGINDKHEQPSPVSVLEPFIQEDSSSPEITVSQRVKPPIQPLQIHLGKHDSSDVVSESSDPETFVSCMEDKRSTFDYVKAVLRISGLRNWDEFLEIWQYSDQLYIDQLLDPPLFDEVEVSSGQLRSDQKLLFDCINEVLVEMYEHYFGCCPWVSFAKPNIRLIPVGENLIHEVLEGIDFHLLPQNQPLTLDRILQKDMARAGKWMDLRFDIDIFGNEMRDTILEELTEEIIYELCM